MSTAVKISGLPDATLPLNDTDLMEVVQEGVSKKAPKSAVSGANAAVFNPALLFSDPVSVATVEKCVERTVFDQAISSTTPTVIFQNTLIGGAWMQETEANYPLSVKRLKFRLLALIADTGGITKTFRLNFGAVSLDIVVPVTVAGAFEYVGEVLIDYPGNDNQLIWATGTVSGQAAIIQSIQGTETLGDDTIYSISAHVSGAGGEITVKGYEIYVAGL